MSAIQQLEDALQERNKKTDEFLRAIMDRINESISVLSTCTHANSTPEVAGSVKVLRKDLDEIIVKIKDNSNIDEHATQGLINRLKLTTLKKRDPGVLPRLSEVDNLSFSDRSRLSDLGSSVSDRSSVPRLSDLGSSVSDRSSIGSSYGTPRSSMASSYGTPRQSVDASSSVVNGRVGGKTRRR